MYPKFTGWLPPYLLLTTTPMSGFVFMTTAAGGSMAFFFGEDVETIHQLLQDFATHHTTILHRGVLSRQCMAHLLQRDRLELTGQQRENG